MFCLVITPGQAGYSIGLPKKNLIFLRVGYPSCHSTDSVEALVGKPETICRNGFQTDLSFLVISGMFFASSFFLFNWLTVI